VTSVKCPIGTCSGDVAVTDILTCKACDTPNSLSTPGSTSIANCVCIPGHFRQSSACVECLEGTYKSAFNDKNCLSCPPSTVSVGSIPYSPAGSISLTQCSSICIAGWYSADDETCTQCPEGKYKEIVGNSNCQACALSQDANTIQISAPGSTLDVACFSMCTTGFHNPSGRTCTLCPEGSYKKFAGNEDCELCAAGEYSTSTHTNCQICPLNSTSSSGSTVCTCDAKFAGSHNVVCTLCVAGQFTNGFACTPCSANTYSSDSSDLQSCEACPPNSQSTVESSSSTACQCNAGISRTNGGPCNPCVAGTYTKVKGTAVCTLYFVGTYSGHAQATCTDCGAN